MPKPRKLVLARTPTPLARYQALDPLVGAEVWVKRDDLTEGAAAGNKIRKLEYLLAEALAQGARAVITCGALQSNHARATAVLSRQLGLRPVLLLRSEDPARARADCGNAFLDVLVGAEIRGITPAQGPATAAAAPSAARAGAPGWRSRAHDWTAGRRG